MRIQIQSESSQLSRIRDIYPLSFSWRKILLFILLVFVTFGIIIPVILIIAWLMPQMNRYLIGLIFKVEQSNTEYTTWYALIDGRKRKDLRQERMIAYLKKSHHKRQIQGLTVQYLRHKGTNYQIQEQTISILQYQIPLHSMNSMKPNSVGNRDQELEQNKIIYGMPLKKSQYANWSWQIAVKKISQSKLRYLMLIVVGSIQIYNGYYIYTGLILLMTVVALGYLCKVMANNHNKLEIDEPEYVVRRNNVNLNVKCFDLYVGDVIVIDAKSSEVLIMVEGLLVGAASLLVNQKLFNQIDKQVSKKTLYISNIPIECNIIHAGTIIKKINTNLQSVGIVVRNNNPIGMYHQMWNKNLNVSNIPRVQQTYEQQRNIFSLIHFFLILIITIISWIFSTQHADLIVFYFLGVLVVVWPIQIELAFLIAEVISVYNMQKMQIRACSPVINRISTSTLALGGLDSLTTDEVVGYISKQGAYRRQKVKNYEEIQILCQEYKQTTNFSLLGLMMYLGCMTLKSYKNQLQDIYTKLFHQFEFQNKQNNENIVTNLFINIISNRGTKWQVIHRYQPSENMMTTIVVKDHENDQLYVIIEELGENQAFFQKPENTFFNQIWHQRNHLGQNIISIWNKKIKLQQYQQNDRKLLQENAQFACFIIINNTLLKQTQSSIKQFFSNDVNELNGSGIKLNLLSGRRTLEVSGWEHQFQDYKIIADLKKQKCSKWITKEKRQNFVLYFGNGIADQPLMALSDVTISLKSNKYLNYFDIMLNNIKDMEKLVTTCRWCSSAQQYIFRLIICLTFVQYIGQLFLHQQSFEMNYLFALAIDILFIIIPLFSIYFSKPFKINSYVTNSSILYKDLIFTYLVTFIVLIVSYTTAIIMKLIIFQQRPSLSLKHQYMQLRTHQLYAFKMNQQSMNYNIFFITVAISSLIWLTFKSRNYWRQQNKYCQWFIDCYMIVLCVSTAIIFKVNLKFFIIMGFIIIIIVIILRAVLKREPQNKSIINQQLQQ